MAKVQIKSEVTTQVNITPYISLYFSVLLIFLPYLKSQYYLFN